MANTNRPQGLTPVKYLNGADWTGQVNQYVVLAADTNPYFPGDVVALTGTGDATRGIQGVTLATAGNTAVGVVVAIGTNPEGGPYINPANLALTSRPSGAQPQNYYLAVVDDPNVIFMAQDTAGALVAANVSRNANFTYALPAAGVAVSGTVINGGSQAVTATLNLKLLGLARLYDQGFLNTYGAFSKWLCLLNNHSYRTGIVGI